MKLNGYVLAVVALMVGAMAATGCNKSSGDPGDQPDPGQPGAQAQTDPGQRGNNDGMRRARRHRNRHGGQWDGQRRGGGQGNRGQWDNRGGGNDPAPQDPQDSPDR